MKKPILSTPQERSGFEKGYKFGYREGMKKVSMMINLIINSTDEFEQSILQNSEEAHALMELLTE